VTFGRRARLSVTYGIPEVAAVRIEHQTEQASFMILLDREGTSGIATMTGSVDDESYAEECLVATMRLVHEIEGYLDQKGVDLALRGIYLTGRYPDTKLIVECLDPLSSDRPKWTASFPIWDESHFKFGSPLLPPDTFAGIVATNIAENAWDERSDQ